MAPMEPKVRSAVSYEQVLYEDQNEASLVSSSTDNIIASKSLQTPQTLLPWKPFYLRRRVLAGFLVMFIAIVTTIEVLVAVSRKNSGIATSTSSSHFLWSYGPTALLVAVAAVWSHTEYQSKLTAPWIRLAQPGVSASRSLLLDYQTPLPPSALFSSLRNRDFTVAIAISVTMILKVLVILSTGLISQSLMSMNETSYPMTLQDTFIDSNAKLATIGDMAWYIMQGLGNRNLSLPEGISTDYAYQTVQVANISETAEIHTTVDGLSNWLDCEPVELTLAGGSPPNPHIGPYSLNITLASSSCNVSLASAVGVPWLSSSNSTLFLRMQTVQCDSTPTGSDENRLLIWVGNMTYASEKVPLRGSFTTVSVGTLERTTQLFCTPEFSISKVDVVRNGTLIKSVSPTPGSANRTLDNVSGWDIVEASLKSDTQPFIQDATLLTQTEHITNMSVNLDMYSDLMLSSQIALFSNVTELFDLDTLREISQAYYRQMGAVLAKQSLMDTTAISTTGSVTINESRHVVSALLAHWMAGLTAACALFTAAALFLVPTRGFLPTNPSTLLGSTLLLLYSRNFLENMRYAGALTEERLSQYLKESKFHSGLFFSSDSNQPQFSILDETDDQQNIVGQSLPSETKPYQPIILHYAVRTSVCLVVVALMLALELLLWKSDREKGLGTIPDNSYIHFSWTVIPAIVFGALTTTVSAVDLKIRTLSPYMALKRHALGDMFTQLDLVDSTVPEAMFKEMKFGEVGALATTTAVLIASFFTIFSSSLFQEAVVPITAPATLRANQSFNLINDILDTDEIASLILESNFSFPQLTYDNMAFPQYILDTELPDEVTSQASSVSLSAVVPAIRGQQNCRMYNSSQVFANITIGDVDTINNPLYIAVDGENPCEFAPQCQYETFENMTYFGILLLYPVSSLVYAWGRMDYNATPILQHISVMACNTTIEVVDVNTTFSGSGAAASFDMDLTQNTPQVIESTARTSAVLTRESTRNHLGNIYGYLANLDNGADMLNDFFEMVVTSPWAVPKSALGDSSADAIASVAKAVRKTHGVIQGQWLARNLVPANQTNGTLSSADFLAGKTADSDLVYNATATVSAGLSGGVAGTRRVVQDTVSTHVLTAMLGATVVFFVLGWATTPHTNVLPRSPTSIASVAALIAGGNLAPRMAATLAATKGKANSSDMVAAATAVPGRRFWLGWGALPTEGTGKRQFGIFVVDEEETSRPGQARERSGTVSSYGSKQSLLSFGK